MATERITQQALESYLWGAAVLLRGLIDAGDYKQFIFPLLFYKRVSDVWDEEYQAALANSGGDLCRSATRTWPCCDRSRPSAEPRCRLQWRPDRATPHHHRSH